jgi:hypothetical protein
MQQVEVAAAQQLLSTFSAPTQAPVLAYQSFITENKAFDAPPITLKVFQFY